VFGPKALTVEERVAGNTAEGIEGERLDAPGGEGGT
jgi:hypothetical protein